jgi:hypothetical protein
MLGFITEAYLTEKAPPGMEGWVKKNKSRFKKKYGKNWASYLYGAAWKIKNKNEDIDEDLGLSGSGSGTLQTPQSKRQFNRAKQIGIPPDELEEEEVNEMNVHPEDKIGQMMLKKRGLPNYFITKGEETHQLNVEEVKKPNVNGNYANTKTDEYGNTVGNSRKGTRAIKVKDI